MGLKEFFNKDDLAEVDRKGVATGERIPVEVNTRWWDAEKIAFARVKKKASALGCNNIFYRSYSAQNPDFLDGVDKTPHYYRIDAVAWR